MHRGTTVRCRVVRKGFGRGRLRACGHSGAACGCVRVCVRFSVSAPPPRPKDNRSGQIFTHAPRAKMGAVRAACDSGVQFRVSSRTHKPTKPATRRSPQSPFLIIHSSPGVYACCGSQSFRVASTKGSQTQASIKSDQTPVGARRCHWARGSIHPRTSCTASFLHHRPPSHLQSKSTGHPHSRITHHAWTPRHPRCFDTLLRYPDSRHSNIQKPVRPRMPALCTVLLINRSSRQN